MNVDRDELDRFLATAPEGLREWPDAQRDALSDAPSLEELSDDEEPDEDPAAAAPARPRTTSTARGINKVLVALLAAAVVLLVQSWGRTPAQEPAMPASHPSVSVSAPAVTFEELDEQRVAELEAKVKANPDDLASLRELAKLHDAAGLWQEANQYQRTILAKDPKDFDALLADGVYRFNSGDVAGAEQAWTTATKVAPDKPEGYYNLGFAHMARQPADKAGAKAAWEQLIEVAPDSELAATAKAHIERLDKEF